MTVRHRSGPARAAALLLAAAASLPSPAAVAQTATDPHALSGMWRQGGMTMFLGIDLPYTAKGQDLVADRIELVKAGHAEAGSHLTCRPTGVAGVLTPKTPILILQTGQEVVVVTGEDREVRYIHLDRGHPEKVEPSYSGDSVGHWDGDTLVVDTIGYNGLGQIDEIGNPQSDQAHVVERWTKTADGNQIAVAYTITDPVYFTKPFTVERAFNRASGARIHDYDCAENPREDDFKNLTFKNDFFRPDCVRPIVKGIAADKIVCTRPKSMGEK